MMRVVSVLIAAIVLAIAAPAEAASFACGTARSKLETLVCDDAVLSRQDEAVAAAYRDAVQAWGGRIAEHVRMVQRDWQQQSGDCVDGLRPVVCLRARYAAREAVLRSPGFRLGGVYVRGKDLLRIRPVAGGLEVGYALADPTAVQGFTAEGQPAPVGPGQTEVAIVLAGEGDDACRLQASFAADEVMLVQTGPCSGNRVGGQWRRDPSLDPESELF